MFMRFAIEASGVLCARWDRFSDECATLHSKWSIYLGPSARVSCTWIGQWVSTTVRSKACVMQARFLCFEESTTFLLP